MATTVAPATDSVALFISTKKGFWIFRSDRERRSWRMDGPHFLGNIVHHGVLDPRDEV